MKAIAFSMIDVVVESVVSTTNSVWYRGRPATITGTQSVAMKVIIVNTLFFMMISSSVSYILTCLYKVGLFLIHK